MTGALQTKKTLQPLARPRVSVQSQNLADLKMNRTDTTPPPPATATSPIDMSQAARDVAFVWDDVTAIKHRAHFLMFDLERGFDISRGTVKDTSVVFQFQQSGIDATVWLCSDIWSCLNDLEEKVEALVLRLEGAAS